jgi:hypothetical protein
MVILIGTLVGAGFTNPEFEEGADAWWAATGAALAGALGGITSALQRTARRSVERVPERLGSLVSSLSRPAIGAIAGVTVFLAVRAGVTQTASEQQVAYLLLLAFGAGFTERLVVRDPREEVADRSDRNETPPMPPSAPETSTATADDGAAGTSELDGTTATADDGAAGTSEEDGTTATADDGAAGTSEEDGTSATADAGSVDTSEQESPPEEDPTTLPPTE